MRSRYHPWDPSSLVPVTDDDGPLTFNDKALDEATGLDRQFFDDHPNRTIYVRPLVDGEFPAEAMGEIPPDAKRWVIVRVIGPGVRVRTQCWLRGEPGRSELAATRLLQMVNEIRGQ